MQHALQTFEIEARKKLTAIVLGQPEDAIRGPAEAVARNVRRWIMVVSLGLVG